MPEEMSSPEQFNSSLEQKPITEWGIGAVEKRRQALINQIKSSSPEEALKLEPKIEELMSRREKLLAPGRKEAERLTKLIEKRVYRDSDYARAEKRIEEACRTIFPDNQNLRVELEEANLDLIRLVGRERETEGATTGKIAQSTSGKNSNMIEAMRILGESLRTESTYDVFVNAELYQAPINLQIDTFPPQWFKNSPEWAKGKDIREWQDLIRARIRMANAAFVKRKVANVNPEAAKDNEFLSLTWREFMLIYNMPGGRAAFEEIFQELFVNAYEDVEGTIWYEFEKGKLSHYEAGEKNGQEMGGYKFRTINREKLSNEEWEKYFKRKGLGLHFQAPDKLKNFIRWRETIIETLKKNEKLEELEARAAFGAVWNIIFVGNAIESADHERWVQPSIVYGEQIRANMHPLVKAKAKILKNRGPTMEVGTEEGWGKGLGNWLTERVVRDPKFRRAFETGKIKPFPETMLNSLFEVIQDGSRRGKTLAERFMKKEKVICNYQDEGGDIFGEYVDIWDSAFKGYSYATGRIPLERMEKKAIQEWTGELADVISKLGGKGYDEYYRDANFLLFCICNSVGIRSHTSKLVLELPDRFYKIDLEAILNPRLLAAFKKPRKIKSQVMNALHGGFLGDLGRQHIDLQRSFEALFKP